MRKRWTPKDLRPEGLSGLGSTSGAKPMVDDFTGQVITPAETPRVQGKRPPSGAEMQARIDAARRKGRETVLQIMGLRAKPLKGTIVHGDDGQVHIVTPKPGVWRRRI